MKLYLPSFKGEEKNTLYFLGNGFDLFHGLNTKYEDFHKWLIQYSYDDFVHYMEKMFPVLDNGEPMLWKDFETALGSADPMEVHNAFFQGVDDGWYNEDVQNRVPERIRIQLEKIPGLLREWIKSISFEDVPMLINLSSQSLYLSFNYTQLLESIYHIPQKQILHIHGSLDNINPLITGHNSFYSEDISNDNTNVEISTRLISYELNRLKKPVDDILKKHHDFFDSIVDIRNIVVFGHSLSMIDRSYFTEVFHRVDNDARWYFVVHSKKAMGTIECLICEFNQSLRNRHGGLKYMNKMKNENCSFLFV